MVREWGGGRANGELEEGFVGARVVFWVVLFSLSIVLAAVFSCADGVTRDKASHADNYGTSCAAGCGAGCGA
uniref:Transmembrane protein n=1 Tax=Kalanchoe fedtschenkoi TaxID=63787 RepID=A0A7N0U1G2_KALFE